MSDNATILSSYSSTTPAPEYQKWLVFFTMIVMQIIGTILYCFIFAAIARNRQTFSGPFYKFLLHVGVNDIFLWLAFYGSWGGTCVLYGQCPVSLLANQMISGLCWLAWYFDMLMDTLIAMERFTAVCLYQYYDTVFSPRKTTVYACVVWILACVIALPLYTGTVPTSYDTQSYASYFDYDNAASTEFNIGTNVIQFFCNAVCLMFYFVSAGYLFWRRMMSSSNNTTTMQRAQRNLLLQGSLRFILLFIFEILWLILPSVNSFWLYYPMAIVIQAIAVNNPLVTILLSTAMREEIGAMLRCKARGGKQGVAKMTKTMVMPIAMNSIHRAA